VVRGLDVTITTTAKTDVEAFELLLALGMPFSQQGRPGQAARAEAEAEAEEGAAQRGGPPAGRGRAGALEQLKEENPEAYAKPEPEEEGEEGRTPPRTVARRPRRQRPRRRAQRMAKTSQKVRQGRKPKFKTRGYNRCRRCGRPRGYYRKFGLCGSACARRRHEGYVPRHDQVELVEKRDADRPDSRLPDPDPQRAWLRPRRVEIPPPGLKEEMSRILKEQGYISDFHRKPARSARRSRSGLKYTEDRRPVISGSKRILAAWPRPLRRSHEVPARARRHRHGDRQHLGRRDDWATKRSERASAAR
jgi:small subunit ribosomal protein S14